MKLNSNAYALLGLTAMVAALVSVVVFAVLKFVSSARTTRRALSNEHSAETAILSAALQDAVTRLKAQERATAARAAASERLSEEIVHSLTAGLIVFGLSGEVRMLNPAGRRMLGLPDDLLPADASSRVAQLGLTPVVLECLRTRVPVLRQTLQLPARTSPASHIGLTVSLLMDATDVLGGAICLFSDLTAVKQLEEQLRLKQSLAAVGELTAGIAHEFRNGLATIHGYARLLDPTQLPESHGAYVQGIRAETEALGQVVTNFLNFAKPAELALTRVDLQAVCTKLADESRSEARALGGDIAVRGVFAAVEGDEVLLRQAFSNLLRNALEACGEAGLAPVVTIVSEVDHARSTVTIAVNDAGPGIPVETRDRVFTPFFTSKRTGTGLGLALVQKIVVSHNGRILVADSPQGGASLQITLPIAR